MLGVDPDATAAEIRRAYRDRARRHHPDRVRTNGGTDTDVMSRVNEAYRVLNDPGRRAIYDRALRGGFPGEFGDARAQADEEAATATTDDTVAPTRPTRLSPSGPARLPWKLMLVTALIGSAVVLVAAAFTDPPSEEPPDGILRAGSCVEIEANGDAREIACTGEGDIVVELLLPTGASCPQGTTAHRDRLGLGTACIKT